MASVGSLVIDLRGNTATFQRDMGRANQILRQNVSSMERSVAGLTRGFQTVMRLAGTFGVALGVGALAAFSRKSLDAAGGLGELAQQVGISTTALQALQYAAVQGGVSAAELETAVAMLTNRIGEAVAGEREAQEAFTRLGVSFKNVDGSARNTEQALDDVMRAFRAETDVTKQAAAAKDLFGRAGQRLLPILASENSSMDEFIRVAERAGVVLDEQAIAKADDASDAWAAFDLRLEKISQTFAITVVSAIVDTMDWLDRLQTKTEGYIEYLERHSNFARMFRLGQEAGEGLFGPLPTSPFDTGSDRGTTARGGRPGLLPTVDSSAKAIREKTSALTQLLAELQNETVLTRMGNEERQIEENVLRAVAAARQDHANKLRESATLSEKEEETVRSRTQTIIDNIKAEQQKAKVDRDQLEMKREMIRAEEELEQQQRETVNSIVDGLRDISSGLVNSAAGFRSWKETAASAIETIFNLFLQLAQQANFWGIFGGTDFTKANLGGSGPGIPPIKPMASGGSGIVTKPTLFMAGEAGAEAFKFTPLGKGGGDGTTVVVNNYSSERATTRESRGPNGQKMIEVTVGQAAAKDIATRGPMAQTLESTYGLKRAGR